MASDPSFVEYVLDQIADDCGVTDRKMFGEYGLFGDGKCIALICDNRLFVKPTQGGRTFIGDDIVEAPAYPGARDSFVVEERLEDRQWLSQLLRITTNELSRPKKKKKKKKKQGEVPIKEALAAPIVKKPPKKVKKKQRETVEEAALLDQTRAAAAAVGVRVHSTNSRQSSTNMPPRKGSKRSRLGSM